MSRQALTVLLAVLAVLALLVGLMTLLGPAGDSREQELLPGLRGELNDISRVTVRGPGDTVIATLAKAGDRWTVAERDGYPADVGRIRQNLIALADAVILEEKTSNPEFYDRLGVSSIASATARGLQLELEGPGGPRAVILGDTDAAGSGTAYVRRTDEATSYLVSGRFEPGRRTADWLDRKLLDIPARRLHRVTIVHPDGETLIIEKASRDASEFTVLNVPRGRELTGPWVAGSVAGALAGLDLDEVQGREALGPEPAQPVVATFVTFDGLVVEASAWRVMDGTRVTFSASADRAIADRFATTAEGEDAPPADFAGVEAEAATINQRLGGWVYTLPGFKTEQLTRRMQDLLAPAS